MECIRQNEILDSILNSSKKDLGQYFETYQNHVYRVYNFAIPYVKIKNEIEILSVAAAFHDLGIWTNNTFDYIKPSIVSAKKYASDNNFDAAAIHEIETIIEEHHKLTKIKASKLAEIFRTADLTDLSLGLFPGKITRKDIRMIKSIFPNKGFHLFLTKIFLKNLIKNPLHPLPMFKL
jgi:hypothetical protein